MHLYYSISALHISLFTFNARYTLFINQLLISPPLKPGILYYSNDRLNWIQQSGSFYNDYGLVFAKENMSLEALDNQFK